MEKLDLNTLNHLKKVFEYQSDFSTKSNGYKYLCERIKQQELDQKEIIKQYVHQWIEGHGSGDEGFQKNAHGNYIYTSGFQSINIKTHFEMLLSDFCEDSGIYINNTQKSELIFDEKK